MTTAIDPLDHRGLVYRVALRYRGRGLDLDDLAQEGWIGLMRACALFDPARGHQFSTFAWLWVRRSILTAIDLRGSAVRFPRGRRDRPSVRRESELGPEGVPLARLVADDHDDLGACEAAMDVPTALRVLDRRQGIVIRRRFGLDGRPRRTHTEIAGGLSLTGERVRQIEADALERLRIKLGGEPGPTPGVERARAVARRRALSCPA